MWLGPGARPVRAASEEFKNPVPTFYERIAAGSLVVRSRVLTIGKRATVQVVEVLKGAYKGDTLQVAFRGGELQPHPGSPKIDFQDGQDSILVLERERDDRDRLREEDRWELVGGWRGKIDLPAEGAPALVQGGPATRHDPVDEEPDGRLDGAA
jgi:hypothetical protein